MGHSRADGFWLVGKARTAWPTPLVACSCRAKRICCLKVFLLFLWRDVRVRVRRRTLFFAIRRVQWVVEIRLTYRRVRWFPTFRRERPQSCGRSPISLNILRPLVFSHCFEVHIWDFNSQHLSSRHCVCDCVKFTSYMSYVCGEFRYCR